MPWGPGPGNGLFDSAGAGYRGGDGDGVGVQVHPLGRIEVQPDAKKTIQAGERLGGSADAKVESRATAQDQLEAELGAEVNLADTARADALVLLYGLVEAEGSGDDGPGVATRFPG